MAKFDINQSCDVVFMDTVLPLACKGIESIGADAAAPTTRETEGAGGMLETILKLVLISLTWHGHACKVGF